MYFSGRLGYMPILKEIKLQFGYFSQRYRHLLFRILKPSEIVAGCQLAGSESISFH
jgi:hypothetical protein